MGEVYLAHDPELERDVALKILAGDVAADQQRMQRFIQEAKTASALNHPNIITIYEVGQAEERRFIATEYIKGETLRQRLLREPLSLRECFEVAVQVAAALSAAHDAKVVHRDIKPDNIMLRPDGLLKVLDFGLAKLTERVTPPPATDPDAATRLQINTAPGLVMGTVNYMSPEQARGKEVDGRTDIWSFGVVLYEMLTGQRPFSGETSSDVIAAILTSEPVPLNTYTTEAPAELQRIVRKALRKECDQRYQTVKDLLIDLKNLQRDLDVQSEIERSTSQKAAAIDSAPAKSTSSGRQPTRDPGIMTVPLDPQPTSSAEYLVNRVKTHKRGIMLGAFALVVTIGVVAGLSFWRGDRNAAIGSIAVLPLFNVGGDSNADYLSDGVAESLIDSLSQLPNLAVKSRSSVYRYKGREIDAKTVGRELGVQAVLSGRLVQHGDALTISFELVDASNDNHIWGAQYDRKLTELVAIQQEVVREVTDKLRLRLTNAEQQRATKGYSANIEAYQLYLRGRYYWNKRTPDGIKKSIDYYQQAIEQDPGYALAYAGLADSFIVPANVMQPQEKYPKAKAAAVKALEIDGTLAEPHAALARAIFEYDWNFAAAEKEYQLAISTNPNYATAHQFYALFLSLTGRTDEGIAEAKRAQALDPLSLSINATLGYVYIYARRNDEAQAQFKKIFEMDPSFSNAHQGLADAYIQSRMNDQAITETLADMIVRSENPETIRALRNAYATGGVKGFWRKQLDLRLAELNQAYISPVRIAGCYAQLGDKDNAMKWLERGYQEHAFGMHALKGFPDFEPMRTDPRFLEMVRRVGLPQ